MLTSTTMKSGPFTLNGVTVAFTFTFKIHGASHLYVVITETDGTEHEMTETTHYAVTGTNGEYETGGTVTITNTIRDLYTTGTITIFREVPLTQASDYVTDSDLPEEQLEKDHDYGRMIDQQIHNLTTRALTVPVTDPVLSLEIPNKATRVSALLGFDADGIPIASAGGASAAVSTFMATVVDDLSASAALTTLGFTAFVKTLLDDVDASAFLTTLGVSAFIKTLVDDADAVEAHRTLTSVKLAADDYVVLDNDGYTRVEVTTAATDRTITLPTASDNTNRRIVIIKVDTGAGKIVVNGEGSEKIAGALIQEIHGKNGSLDLLCDGTKWSIIDKSLLRFLRGALMDTWKTRTSPADNYWESICWSHELGLFCGVANNGTNDRVMTSPDGITWTSRDAADENSWRHVCWSPELALFVAVAATGTNDRVMTSPDGINWTARDAADENAWYGVCWSPELTLFCAVANTGTNDRVMTSPDGINWTARDAAAENQWIDVCWSPELSLFCAIAWTGTNDEVMTSPDGINWTSRTPAASTAWSAICWSPELSLFCVTGTVGAGNQVMTSADGIDWALRTTAADGDWLSVCWSSELGLFCAISATTAEIMTSPDGTNWTLRIAPAENNWQAICWSPELGLFCAVGNDSVNTRVMTTEPCR